MKQIVTIHQNYSGATFDDPAERLLPDLGWSSSGRSYDPVGVRIATDHLLDRFASQLIQAYPELKLLISLLAERAIPIEQVTLNAGIDCGVDSKRVSKVCRRL